MKTPAYREWIAREFLKANNALHVQPGREAGGIAREFLKANKRYTYNGVILTLAQRIAETGNGDWGFR